MELSLSNLSQITRRIRFTEKDDNLSLNECLARRGIKRPCKLKIIGNVIRFNGNFDVNDMTLDGEKKWLILH